MAKLDHFLIRPYQKGDNKHPFSCGTAELDHYFRSVLSQDIRRNQAAGYVLYDQKQERVAGYFTISATHIALSDVPEEHRKQLPYNQIPFILLGRLAVDDQYHGQGLGNMLMMAVFDLACTLKQQLGVWGVAVDPISPEAEAFYAKFDFVSVKDDRRMFINLKTVEKLLR